MTTPLPPHGEPEPASPARSDEHLARLTAKADLIVEELDLVVKQMSELFKRKYQS